MNDEVATLGVEEAGRICGIGKGTSYRLVREGRLPCLRLGRKLRVPRVQLEALLRGEWRPVEQENASEEVTK